MRRLDPPRCIDCGQRHPTSGDAHACDHACGRHPQPVRGCPQCLPPTRRPDA